LGVKRRLRRGRVRRSGGRVGRVLFGEELLRRRAGDLAGAVLVEVVTHRSAEGGNEKHEDSEHKRAPSGNEPCDAPQGSELARELEPLG
jgi:hypothetical protein